jgi:NTE family protein
MIRLVLLAAVVLSTYTGAVSAAGADRPRVGLVLAGGGARGIAHVGVIRALEELQVPVDAIAGTSMGALVGGLYASGMTAAELSEVVATMDWGEAFEDRLHREQLPPRRKSDDFDYASDIRVTVQDGAVKLPLGVVQGQQVRQLIKELMLPVASVRDFDDLPIPFRAVATDIETGKAYVFAQGDVVTAMRASMSLPAILAPVEWDGRLLVDGGLANNIPVDVARSMGVDRLVVVDIGTPMRSREEIDSILSVADQMINFLTRRNSEAQLDTLGPGDLLVRPDLGTIGMLDFDRGGEVEAAGYAAAMALAPSLRQLAIGSGLWERHIAEHGRPTVTAPVIDFIAIENDSAMDDATIRVRINQPIGEPLDRDLLQRDIAQVYALDYWELIDYQLVERGGDTGLLLSARAKARGEHRFKLGLNLITDLNGRSDINVGTSYLVKGLNRRGGEIYGRAQVGDIMLLTGEYYQPLDLQSRYFFAPYAGYTDYRVTTLGPEFDVEDLVGTWRVRDLRLELSVGANVLGDSQFRAGVFRGVGEYSPDVDFGNTLPEDSFQEGGVFAAYRFDNLDNAYFPTRGALFYSDYEVFRDAVGADANFERWQAFGQAALTFGADDRNTVLFTGKFGQTDGAPGLPQNLFPLGGLFNLSGLSQDVLFGRQLGFVMAQYQRRLSDNSVLPFSFPVYLGASVEGGQLWSHRSDMDLGDLTAAGSIYLGLDSPIGPLYLAYGYNDLNQDAIYLTLGWPFLVGSNRLRR